MKTNDDYIVEFTAVVFAAEISAADAAIPCQVTLNCYRRHSHQLR